MSVLKLKNEGFSEKEKRNIEILEVLRKRGPISRPDISKELGINVVTVSNYIDEFIKNNVVYEKELDVSEGGRRPALLDLNTRSGYVVGVDLNLMNMVGLLIDFKGNIVTKTQISRPKASVKEISECMLEIIREIFRRSKAYTANIKGIGVGVAGLINKKNGSIHWPQKIDQYYTYASVDVPLQDMIEREFNLPALIENDATCACFGEHWLHLDRSIKNIIYMFSGVGCGILMNGEVYTGSHGYAGEISVDNYKEDSLFNCAMGNSCFLKRWELDLGIIEDMQKKLAKGTGAAEKFFRLTGSKKDELNLKDIFSAYKAKEELAVSVLDLVAKRLGIKIAYLVNLLNPQVVIIGGGLEEAGEDFLNKIIITIKEWAFREETDDLKVIYSQLRENAVALGAASLVTQRVFAGLLL